MSIKITVLKADHGDAFAISGEHEGAPWNVLIDGGISKTFKFQQMPMALKKFLNEVKRKNQQVDLVILTHVDQDHIGGLLAAFNESGYLSDLCKEVWFNSGKLIAGYFAQPFEEENIVRLGRSGGNDTSIAEGVTLETHLENLGLMPQQVIRSGQCLERFGCKFKILSPNDEKLEKLLDKWIKETAPTETTASSLTAAGSNDYDKSFTELLVIDHFEEDSRPHNGSSIAFIFEHEDKSVLFTGDSHPSILVESLTAIGYNAQNPLKLEYMKVSHHGSKKNTNHELLELIDCNNFIISTNGKRHNLPNKVTLARIAKHFPNANFMFNYPDVIQSVFADGEHLEGTYSAIECDEILL